MILIKQIWHMVARSIAVMLAIVFVSACASSTSDRYQAIEQDAATSGFSAKRFGVDPPLVGMLRAPRNLLTISQTE